MKTFVMIVAIVFLSALLAGVGTYLYFYERPEARRFRHSAKSINIGMSGGDVQAIMKWWWWSRGVVLYDEGLLLLLDANGRSGSDRPGRNADFYLEFPPSISAKSIAPQNQDFLVTVSGERKVSPLEPEFLEQSAWDRIEGAILESRVVKIVLDASLPLHAWEMRVKAKDQASGR